MQLFAVSISFHDVTYGLKSYFLGALMFLLAHRMGKGYPFRDTNGIVFLSVASCGLSTLNLAMSVGSYTRCLLNQVSQTF